MTHKKAVLVTGGGQGMGKCVTKRLIGSGMAAAIGEVDREAGREAEEEFRHIGSGGLLETDVSDEASVEKRVRLALKNFGRLDFSANNQGTAHPVNAPEPTKNERPASMVGTSGPFNNP